MSVRISAWAWQQQLPPARKLVLLALADSASDDGLCWPSWQRLAAMTGCSRAQLGRHLAALESAGLISRTARRTGRGRRASSIITIGPALWTTCGQPVDNCPDGPSPSLAGETLQVSPVRLGHLLKDFEPSFEPSTTHVTGENWGPGAPDGAGPRLTGGGPADGRSAGSCQHPVDDALPPHLAIHHVRRLIAELVGQGESPERPLDGPDNGQVARSSG